MSVLRYCTFEVILAMESQLLSDCNNEMCLHRSALSALQHFQGIEMSSSMSPKTLVGSKCEKNPLRRQKQFPKKKKESLSESSENYAFGIIYNYLLASFSARKFKNEFSSL